MTSNQENWTRSDRYHNSFLIPEDQNLNAALKNSDDNGLPAIAITAAQGKFLNLIAKSIQAKRILEVGTLGGYSTIWLARALPEDGKLVTAELKQHHADVARVNVENVGLSSKVDILVGPAAETLAKLQPDDQFDLAFIDADNASYGTYFIEVKRLVRKGGVIIVDNVVWGGEVADLTKPEDDSTKGTRQILKHIKEVGGVEATTIGTVGEKGYDGFLYAVVQ